MKIAVLGQFSTTIIAVRALIQAGHTVDVFAPQEYADSFARYGIFQLVEHVYFFDSLSSEKTVSAFQYSRPDAMIGVVCGHKVPDILIDMMPAGGYNFHPAALPEFRSGNAWFWPIRMGSMQSALTIHRLTQKWDSGNVVWSEPFALGMQDTQGIYVERVNALAPQFFANWGTRLTEGSLEEHVQDESVAKYYPKLRFRHILINWKDSAESIYSLVRACNPYHFAQAMISHHTVEIVECKITDRISQAPGYITVAQGRMWVGTGSTDIELLVIKFFEFGLFSCTRFLEFYPLNTGEVAQDLAADPSVNHLLDQLL